MSIIFGLLESAGSTIDRHRLFDLSKSTNRYALDGTFVVANGRIGMAFQPFHTHERSRLECQPVSDNRGNMLTLDGRLDNHSDLRQLLDIDDPNIPDSGIVLSAFQRWGEACFSRFVGDWAVALWSGKNQSLYLARDHAGTRTLFYELSRDRVLWSTYLETFVLNQRARPLEERYAAAYLGSVPIGDLTPYQEIRSVRPAHFVVLYENTFQQKPHWCWTPPDKIHYRCQQEYEEHFLFLFKQSVQRRTGPGAPILAQLSGGMDSSSIVCMSDHICKSDRRGPGELIDTLSFYDDTELNWNEKPYFSLIESVRGKIGIHFSTSNMDPTLEPADPRSSAYLLPGADSASARHEEVFHSTVAARGYRAIISGIGGDEILGGVPTPLPELADYLVTFDINRLCRQSLSWCLNQRAPLTHLLLRTAWFTFRLYQPFHVDRGQLPPWISARLMRTCRDIETERAMRRIRFCAPSRISNGLAWWYVLETLPHLYPEAQVRYEYRYPYLDRDLVDFIFRIPRDQVLRPGRRRFLMRNAMKHLVPPQILERRRKAYVVQGPLRFITGSRNKIATLIDKPLLHDYGLVDVERLRIEAYSITGGEKMIHWAQLMRSISFELWLQSMRGVVL